MYKGKKLEESSIIHKSFNNTSLLSESTNQVFEREIDNYTKLLEQDKRKFFRVQENRNEVVKEYSKKAKELDLLQNRQFSSEMVKMKSKVRILENEMDQTINSYNQVLSSNKKLKAEIDELRKQKLNQKEVMTKITCRIEDSYQQVTQKQEEIDRRKELIEQDKSGILNIKAQNQSEARLFRTEVCHTDQNMGSSKAGNHVLKRRIENDPKNEGTDTLPLVRYRLRHLIAKNKEKVKVIESYRKTMEAIWKSFEEIKEQSGANELEGITSTFLKHEQQNHFIYEYIGKLNRENENLSEETEHLREKIDLQKELNKEYQQNLGATPKKVHSKMSKMKKQEHCEEQISNMDQFLKIATAGLKECGGQSQLTMFNLIQEFAELESQISEASAGKEDLKVMFHEDVTKYTKGPPNCSEEAKENREEKLMDREKLHEYASDFWEKRRPKS